jgi:hypothetical protein
VIASLKDHDVIAVDEIDKAVLFRNPAWHRYHPCR